jgi:hypothetical protein
VPSLYQKISPPLQRFGVSPCDNGTIDVFLKKHFLHWLKALSLMKSISSAVTAIKKLEILLAVRIQSPLM